MQIKPDHHQPSLGVRSNMNHIARIDHRQTSSQVRPDRHQDDRMAGKFHLNIPPVSLTDAII